MTDLIAGIFTILIALLVGLLIACFLAFPFMWLWNELMPELFGLKYISFWQSVGLLFLCELIFKSHTSSNKED